MDASPLHCVWGQQNAQGHIAHLTMTTMTTTPVAITKTLTSGMDRLIDPFHHHSHLLKITLIHFYVNPKS